MDEFNPTPEEKEPWSNRTAPPTQTRMPRRMPRLRFRRPRTTPTAFHSRFYLPSRKPGPPPENRQGTAPRQAYPTSPAPRMPYPQQAQQGIPCAPGAMPSQPQAYYPAGAAPAGYLAADPAVFQKAHGIHKRIREAEGFCIFIAFCQQPAGLRACPAAELF